MTAPLPYAACLSLVDERSAALREALAAAPDRQARIPGCPDWTLVDLALHLGRVQRWWATVVRAGAADDPAPFDESAPPAPEALVEWSAESTRLLLAALTEVGPQAPCWTWWPLSQARQDAAAVARHQVQEAAVHAYDAQEAIGRPEPVPAAVAVDGVAEFLLVTYGAEGPWPHRPARVVVSCTEGPSWTLDLTPAGARLDPAAGGAAVSTVRGSASDVLLALFGRRPLDTLRIDGDRGVVEQLRAWGDTN
jgi:uncharacterized protein (TIGR03083 family)